jgi:cholest-4-en-3-one 26-monooxygenase
LRDNEPCCLHKLNDPMLIDQAWIVSRNADIWSVDRNSELYAADRRGSTRRQLRRPLRPKVPL